MPYIFVLFYSRESRYFIKCISVHFCCIMLIFFTCPLCMTLHFQFCVNFEFDGQV